MDYHIYNFNIMIHTDINNLQHQCLINKETYHICQNKYFWMTYFNQHGLFLDKETDENNYPSTFIEWKDLFEYTQDLYKRANMILLVQQVEEYKHYIVIPSHIYNIQDELDLPEFMSFQYQIY
jgi:hypothetical protein